MSWKSPHQRTNTTYFGVEFRETWVPSCPSHDSHCARVLFQSYADVIFGRINWPPASQVISMWRFWEDVMRRGGSESVKEHYVPEREFIFISFAVRGVGDTTECTLATHTPPREAFIIPVAACTNRQRLHFQRRSNRGYSSKRVSLRYNQHPTSERPFQTLDCQ